MSHRITQKTLEGNLKVLNASVAPATKGNTPEGEFYLENYNPGDGRRYRLWFGDPNRAVHTHRYSVFLSAREMHRHILAMIETFDFLRDVRVGAFPTK